MSTGGSLCCELAEEGPGGEDEEDAAEAVTVIFSRKGMWWRQRGPWKMVMRKNEPCWGLNIF